MKFAFFLVYTLDQIPSIFLNLELNATLACLLRFTALTALARLHALECPSSEPHSGPLTSPVSCPKAQPSKRWEKGYG